MFAIDYSQYEMLNITKQDGTLTITLNNPTRKNAVNRRMHLELERIWDDVDADEDVHLVAGGRVHPPPHAFVGLATCEAALLRYAPPASGRVHEPVRPSGRVSCDHSSAAVRRGFSWNRRPMIRVNPPGRCAVRCGMTTRRRSSPQVQRHPPLPSTWLPCLTGRRPAP